jgi:hypothetical protein
MDPVDAAIAASQQPGQVQLQQVGPVVIGSTGRPVVMAVPPDLTDDELLEFASWLLNPGGLRAQLRRPTSRIVLPGQN